ncbi:hypothetical protein QTG56_24755 (plasmid) [Rossellomorea sp. AcN35-11]|nr:hypothetical protein [Rossellomorea aquimaris]WJV31846.1 hypothetical protein QTG56_24755 [Rossellomorea sp. AcN35-11]
MDGLRICNVEYCNKKAAVKNMCSKHYQRWRKYGDANYVKSQQNTSKVICKVEDCDSYSLEGIPLCTTHLEKLKEVDAIQFIINGHRVCEVEGCTRSVQAKGRCGKHYKQLRNGTTSKRETIEVTLNEQGERICNFPGCDRFHQSKGYCSKHYQKYAKENKKDHA